MVKVITTDAATAENAGTSATPCGQNSLFGNLFNRNNTAGSKTADTALGKGSSRFNSLPDCLGVGLPDNLVKAILVPVSKFFDVEQNERMYKAGKKAFVSLTLGTANAIRFAERVEEFCVEALGFEPQITVDKTATVTNEKPVLTVVVPGAGGLVDGSKVPDNLKFEYFVDDSSLAVFPEITNAAARMYANVIGDYKEADRKSVV